MMNKRDLIKFYAYLDNNGYLKEEYKNFQSMKNTIVNFIKTLPNVEASRVSENEQPKEYLKIPKGCNSMACLHPDKNTCDDCDAYF